MNSVTRLVSWPLPTIDEIIDAVSEARPTLFSNIDLFSEYWQACMDDESAAKTDFETHERGFIFRRVSMGLCGAPAFFQQLMQKVLRN